MINTVREVCRFLGQCLPVDPVCVETGITYCCVEPEHDVHTTTNNILDYVSGPNGKLYSLDIDKEHCEFARKFCDSGDEHVIILGDSVSSMKQLSKIVGTVDLLCLDSMDFDEDHMVNEYEAIASCLSDNHYVLVDDIHNPNSVKYKKMVPELIRLGYETVEIKTPTGMLIASKGLPLPEGQGK